MEASEFLEKIYAESMQVVGSDDTIKFVENYVNLIETDTALKFEHKKEWNNIISQM